LANQMSQVDSAINAELRNLSERYKNEYLAASNTEKMLQNKFEEQKQKAYDLNQGAAQYAILKHEVEGTQDLYQTLELKLKQAGIVAGLASANIGIVEPGQVPSEPIDPQPVLDLALGLGCGLGIGVLSAIALEMLDTTIRGGEEAESVAALPILAEIPQVDSPKRSVFGRRLPALPVPEIGLIAYHHPQSQAAESYRCLRTSLLLPSRDRPPQAFSIASCLSAEGKTSTAVNCAVVLAQQGAKVLLVDTDLRQPAIHTAFKIPEGPGLNEVLTGVCRSDEAFVRSDLLPSLTVLPAGNHCACPAETLASPNMTELLDHWRTHYDHIIFDTPPVSQFTDGVVLGAQVDAVLLVARCGATTRFALRYARDRLQRANLNVIGVVLNGADTRYDGSYYHHFDYGFGAKRAEQLES